VVTTVPRTGQVLTAEQVREARRAVAGGEQIVEVADRYGVNGATLGSAVRGKTYGWITDVAPVQLRRSSHRRGGGGTPAGRSRRLTVADTVSDADVAACAAFAREMIAAGADTAVVADELGVTLTLLRRWLGLPESRRRRRSGGGGAVRLTVTMVADLRRWAAAGATIAELSRETGVPDRTIGAAIRGRTWQSVDEVVPPVRSRPDAHKGAGNPTAKLTAEVVADMRRQVAGGATVVEVAARHGATESAVGQAVRGRSWSNVDGVPPVRQRTFTRTDRDPADKAALVELAQSMIDAGASVPAAAGDLGLSPHTLYSWLTRRR
jgi:transposase-like protein